MSKVRYKIRREQLERVVEHFVMESAMIEKNAAKKHKMSMGTEQSDDMGDGMVPAKEVKNPKMKQAPEVKKNIHGKVNESMGSNVSVLKNVDPNLLQMVRQELKGITKDQIEDAVDDASTMGEAKSGKLLAVGGTLFALGLIGLGVDATITEKLVNSLKDDVTINTLNNAAWVASAISTIAGMVTAGVGVKRGYGEREQEWIGKAKADGYTEKGETRDGKMTMTNPETGRFRIYKG